MCAQSEAESRVQRLFTILAFNQLVRRRVGYEHYTVEHYTVEYYIIQSYYSLKKNVQPGGMDSMNVILKSISYK